MFSRPRNADDEEVKVPDFAHAPLLVIWETTRSCELACVHCRASAVLQRSPHELTTDEGKRLLGEIREMGTPLVVLSGGNPAQREDLAELVKYGKSIGLRMSTILAGGSTLTHALVHSLKEAGLDQLAFSIDFPEADLHDGFRKAPGSFDRTLKGAQWALEEGIPLQINSVISAGSLPYLHRMGELVKNLGTVFWEVFFLVPIGRATSMESLEPAQCEDAFEYLYGYAKRNPIVVKVTEAPHYRRFAAQKEGSAAMPKIHTSGNGGNGKIGLAGKAVNAGCGFVFVSHEGEISPSGFLPLNAGNVRTDGLAEVYRNHPVFLELRDPSRILGKCGRCEYVEICGGSRARGYAMTGNYLASDPWCAYRPTH